MLSSIKFDFRSDLAKLAQAFDLGKANLIQITTISGYVQGTLQQTAVQYGWVMMGFGLGAAFGSLALGTYPQY